MSDTTHRLPVLGVLGPGLGTPRFEAVAEQVGELAARSGWVVLTGGGPGVMAAACRGAVSAGGLTVGIIPTAMPVEGYPNQWVRLAIYTGAGMARNAFNVLSANLCVAIGGGPGTLSEVAMALKAGIQVWAWQSWSLAPPEGTSYPVGRSFETADELLDALRVELEPTPE
jgi:uncharacterized protein (TIGR00725 family)